MHLRHSPYKNTRLLLGFSVLKQYIVNECFFHPILLIEMDKSMTRFSLVFPNGKEM